jgi:hypothetical protein
VVGRLKTDRNEGTDEVSCRKIALLLEVNKIRWVRLLQDPDRGMPAETGGGRGWGLCIALIF